MYSDVTFVGVCVLILAGRKPICLTGGVCVSARACGAVCKCVFDSKDFVFP